VLCINVSNTIRLIPNPAAPEPVMAVGMAPRTTFGGAIPAEIDFLAFSDLAQAKSWVMTPSRAEVQAVMAEVGAANAVLAL
jgi:beta-glucosidase